MDRKLEAIINDLNCAKLLSDLDNNTNEYLNMLAFLGLDRAIELAMKMWVENTEGNKVSNIRFHTRDCIFFTFYKIFTFSAFFLLFIH